MCYTKPNLIRYLEVQSTGSDGSTFATALAEMKRGKKTSCWIWYVFPQFLDPGRASSSRNQKFQFHSAAEVIAFLKHETLGKRLMEISSLTLAAMKPANKCSDVMGGRVDLKKLHQSITCFCLAAEVAEMTTEHSVFRSILDRIVQEPYVDGISPLEVDMHKRWSEALAQESPSRVVVSP